MSSLYVTLSSSLSRPQDRRTGIPRVEYEIARELSGRGAGVVRYDGLLRRFRVTTLTGVSAAGRPGDGDTIFVPGIFWRRGPLAELTRLRRTSDLRIGVYIHDIMPIRRPELVSNDNGAADFRRFIDTMIGCADWMCVSSRFVGQDLTAYVRESGGRKIPVHHVPLCADLAERVAPRLSPRLRSLDLPANGYVLYVSTLNPRKNHTGIYWLWRRLFEELGEATPPLVLAGQRGWNDHDIFDLMSRDPKMWERHIRFVEGPSDAELVQLYRDCAFTVYPSYHEGWGLPITESLSFGKPCVAGDNTSLREAGQGLAIHVDDLDGPGWLAAIKRLALDARHRSDSSAQITARYKPRGWSDVGSQILELAKRAA